jgi:hypothetical protein
MKSAGQLPVDRSGGKAARRRCAPASGCCNAGNLLGIYPEGTRSPDGRLYRGKTGVARMALEGAGPRGPVAMIDTEKAQPPGQLVPNIRQVGVRIGKPLDFSRYYGMEADRFVLRSITDEIMYELMELSGQEYVDVYAASMKDRLKRSGNPQPEREPRRRRGASAAPGSRLTTSAPLTPARSRATRRTGGYGAPYAPTWSTSSCPRRRSGAPSGCSGCSPSATPRLSRLTADEYARPVAAWLVIVAHGAWTAVVVLAYEHPRRAIAGAARRRPGVAVAAVLATRLVDDPVRATTDAVTLPTFLGAAAVLAWALASARCARPRGRS